ncbi:MAG TPA: hypothetical protein VF170_16970 [Planctomycetaceae bacterium]
MKAVGIAFTAGLLGMLIGSLAAQPQTEDFAADPSDDSLDEVLYEGRVESISLASGGTIGDAGETARVYDSWIFLADSRRFVPREQIAVAAFQRDGDARPEDFGTEPEGDRPRRRTFRED